MMNDDIVQLGIASEATLGGPVGSPEVIGKQMMGLSDDE